MAHELTLEEIEKFQQDYQQNKQNKIAACKKPASTVKEFVI